MGFGEERQRKRWVAGEGRQSNMMGHMVYKVKKQGHES